MKTTIAISSLILGLALTVTGCLTAPESDQNTGGDNLPDWTGNQGSDSASEESGGETPTTAVPTTLDEFMYAFAQATCNYYIENPSTCGDWYTTVEECTTGQYEAWTENKDYPSCIEPAEAYFFGHKEELMDCLDTSKHGSCGEGAYSYSTCPAYKALFIDNCTS